MFPRTNIENLSVSRLMIGTNWLLGYSHTSKALDRFIVETVDAARITEVLVAGLQQWMEMHEYESVNQMKGALSQRACAEPAAFERANYMKVLGSWH